MDMKGFDKFLPPVDPSKLVGGKAYTVAGKRSDIKEIIRNCGSEIIGAFHETIDAEMGICYIRKPNKENGKKMLKEFREKNILVWREKEVQQATNGYELDLATEADFKFAKDNKDKIKFLGSPDIKENIENFIYPSKISYTIPKGCYCTPNGKPGVGTPNKSMMGVKIDTVQKTNNTQISREDLDKILKHHQKKPVLPKQESKETKTKKR